MVSSQHKSSRPQWKWRHPMTNRRATVWWTARQMVGDPNDTPRFTLRWSFRSFIQKSVHTTPGRTDFTGGVITYRGETGIPDFLCVLYEVALTHVTSTSSSSVALESQPPSWFPGCISKQQVIGKWTLLNTVNRKKWNLSWAPDPFPEAAVSSRGAALSNHWVIIVIYRKTKLLHRKSPRGTSSDFPHFGCLLIMVYINVSSHYILSFLQLNLNIERNWLIQCCLVACLHCVTTCQDKKRNLT